MPRTDTSQIERNRAPSESHYISAYSSKVANATKHFENKSDNDFLASVLRQTIDDIEIIMSSEYNRLRSFRNSWRYESVVSSCELAKSGFYHLNSIDRVKCAFCSVVLKQWKQGDSPMIRHKTFAGYCKLVQGRCDTNIPFDPYYCSIVLPPDIDINKLSIYSYASKHAVKPSFSSYSVRKSSFPATFPHIDNKEFISKLADAGFLFEPGNKTTCFFCGGVLHEWNSKNDPWVEHATWFPLCLYVLYYQGLDFVAKARRDMSVEDFILSKDLVYKHGPQNIEELEQVFIPKYNYKQDIAYKFAKDELNICDKILDKAYKHNSFEAFTKPSDLLKIVYDIIDNADLQEKEVQTKTKTDEEIFLEFKDNLLKSIKSLDADESTIDGKMLANVITCKICFAKRSGAIFLPCGCFSLCQDCCKLEKLPNKCPSCQTNVKAACLALLP